MINDETKRFLKIAKGLFPTITIEQLEQLGRLVDTETWETATELIKAHHFAHDFYSPSAFAEALRAHRAKSTTGELPKLSFAEHLAREKNCDPIEAVLRHYRGEWFQYSTFANQRMSNLGGAVEAERVREFGRLQADGFRRRCTTGVIGCFVEQRVPLAVAEQWAPSIFAHPKDFALALAELRHNGIDRAPEEISTRQLVQTIDVWQEPTGEVPTSFNALKQLATAERGQAA